MTFIGVMTVIFMVAANFFWSLFLEDELNDFGHFRPRSSLICIRILFASITKVVNFKFFFETSGLFLLDLESNEWSLRSFFLFYESLISSFFHLLAKPFVVKASSPFIYFWALNNRSFIEVGGVFPREKMKSGEFSPAWKVVIMI